MKAQKNKKINLCLFILLFFGIGQVTAQSRIGVVAPPFQSSIQFSINFQFSPVQNIQLDATPYQIRTAYLLSESRPPAFNSPFVDKVLTTVALFNQINGCPTMPFFCDIECQMEQASGFPVKFRLGDVNYVDQLEGKIDYVAPVW